MAIQALSLPLPDESARVEASPEQLDPEAAIGASSCVSCANPADIPTRVLWVITPPH